MDNRVLGDPGAATFQVRKYPFYLLNRLVGRYNIVIEAKLRTIDLDIPYWRVLMILGEAAPRGVRDIAEAAVIPLSTMTRIVQRMTTAGLVEVRPSPADARVTEVSLSALGQDKLAAARHVAAPVYERIVRGLSARDFDKLLSLLDQLHANLDDN